MNDTPPFTDADLRTEAARQHANLVDDPDFMGVGEGMEDAYVDSTLNADGEGKTWADLLPYEADRGEAYNAAQRKIHELIPGADLSQWAVDLGADGLEPAEAHLNLGADRPLARIHFAFAPDADEDTRIALVKGVGAAISQFLL
ncbi:MULTISPECIES: hypothetical protein [Streptomyces]|uniref:Uncharacterized protein n=1 Tax=Streptomyces evansiae TaxID=3075535 RepID=A0ABU2R0N8_9ACTN|nr:MULTISPECIES: hypothetical protein [unclassified Streptomyces]MDT0409912.1 hypothetical protein [Streptomyces sp. DSM 41979]MYQ60000.1 hypothetical protein [Streptomyces sp. SID4926]SCE40276.1 hypothetical protein GA0115252_146422 [Streptomyces sp. DfronAA-171]